MPLAKRECQPIALLRFRHHPNAAQPHHDPVSPAQIAQPPAPGLAIAHDDHGVHALIGHCDPFVAVADEGVVIGAGIKILGRAAVSLHLPQHRVAGIDRSAAQFQQPFEQPVERRFVFDRYLQAEIGSLAIGAPDAKLLHFEPAALRDDLVEDVFHDMGIDEVAFGFDHFLKGHRSLL